MSDDRPIIHTIPTHLDRQDAYFDGAVLAGAVLGSWRLWQLGIPVPVLVVPLLPILLWYITGESAADVPGIGNIAAGLRSKLGLRRAHEWALAAWHYFVVAVWPIWRAWIERKRHALADVLGGFGDWILATRPGGWCSRLVLRRPSLVGRSRG